jgi:hypothetical protein
VVKSSRKKTILSRIRPLNKPEPIQVGEDKNGMPGVVALRRHGLSVTSIQDVWDVLDEWWRTSPIARRYYTVKLEDGRTITIFHDLVQEAWYEQHI